MINVNSASNNRWHYMFNLIPSHSAVCMHCGWFSEKKFSSGASVLFLSVCSCLWLVVLSVNMVCLKQQISLVAGSGFKLTKALMSEKQFTVCADEYGSQEHLTDFELNLCEWLIGSKALMSGRWAPNIYLWALQRLSGRI